NWDEKLINTQEYDLMFRICKFNSNVRFSDLFLTVIYEVPNSISRDNGDITQKVLNQYILRKSIFDYICQFKTFRFFYKINFNGYIGTLLRNSKGDVHLKYSKFFYS